MIRLALFLGTSLALAAGCGRNSGGNSAAPPAPAEPDTSLQVFQVKGVVVALDPDGRTVRIRHEEIPNYMAAMTMPFAARVTNELAGLAPGDAVAFRLSVTETDGWIDEIEKLASSATNTLPPDAGMHIVRDVEPLAVGDVLPEYFFTNHLGEHISTAQFRGGVLAVNFLFTRCPFPTMCPFLANNFAGAQDKLLALTNAPADWHLLTISFDPEFDTPAQLKRYAAAHGCDARRWTFATGALVDINALGDQLGLQFWRDETGSINHNLRAAVFDARGRLQTNFIGNQWTSGDLVGELLKAASAP